MPPAVLLGVVPPAVAKPPPPACPVGTPPAPPPGPRPAPPVEDTMPLAPGPPWNPPGPPRRDGHRREVEDAVRRQRERDVARRREGTVRPRAPAAERLRARRGWAQQQQADDHAQRCPDPSHRAPPRSCAHRARLPPPTPLTAP